MSTIISASLFGDVIRAEGERAHQRGISNLQAWSLYQFSLQIFDRFTSDDFAQARRFLKQTGEFDGCFATALGQATIAGYGELMLEHNGSREQLIANMMYHVRSVVELDARDPAGRFNLEREL